MIWFFSHYLSDLLLASFALTPLSAGPLLSIRCGNVLLSSFLLLLFLLTPETLLSQDLLVPFKLFYVLIIPCNFSHIKQHLHNIYIIVLNFVHAHTHIYGWPKSQVFLNTLWKILNKLFGPPKKTHTYMCVSCNLLCNYSFCPISLERAMPNYTITEIPESSRKPGKQMPNQYLSNHYVNKGHSPLLFFYHLPTLLNNFMTLIIFLSNILRMALTISLMVQDCLDGRGKE